MIPALRARPLVLLLLAGACARPAVAPLSPRQFPFAVDSTRTEAVRPGVARHAVYSSAGPWVVQVLDVRLDRCYTAVAVKGSASAVGRRKTSVMLGELAATRDVVGGVNADFFDLGANPGLPTNLHVSGGRVLTPPNRRPVFAIDSAGRPHIATFTLSGLDSLRIDDPRLARASLRPFHPLEAVGGRPILLRDSALVAGLDSAGGVAFATTRHPRTAVGIADGGKRLLLVVVDGRQPAWSVGMSLRETASLMLALGAREAINLDGGGSSALVYADRDSARVMRIANHPSDPTGERAVGNALAIVRECRGR